MDQLVLRTEMHPEEGQAAISLILILGLFLLGIFGFAVDLTNIWFHRQAAQAAADAACLAGSLDMLSASAGLAPPAPGFTIGNSGDCVRDSIATMCAYARFNGYNGAGLDAGAASNAVSWSFPATVAGVTGGAPAGSFLSILISENVTTYFMGLLTAAHVQKIDVSTVCGLGQVEEAAPMTVLDPGGSGSFTASNGALFGIVGGPLRGLQVNSSSASAVSLGGSIDLSLAGPKGTGSDAGIVGGPAAAPTPGFNGGSTGLWRSGVLPVADPFGQVPAPTTPALAPPPKWVQYQEDGCPDQSNNIQVSQSQPNESCQEFFPGYYPNGLSLSGSATSLFAPGIYFMNGGLKVTGTVTLRNAYPPGTQATDGVMFYFLTGSASLSGGVSKNVIDNAATTALTCDGSAPPASLGLPGG